MNVAMLMQVPIEGLLSGGVSHGIIARPTPIEAVSYIAEPAEIAAGFFGLRQRHGRDRQSSRFAHDRGESSLDCAANQSGHVGTKSNRRAAK